MAVAQANTLERDAAGKNDLPPVMASRAEPAGRLPGMQLTARDITLLQFINDCGFCEMPQIEKVFGLTKRRSYQIMERLREAGLVKHERIFYGRHGIFRLTSKGASHTDLPVMARVTLGAYNHILAIVDVRVHLHARHADGDWLSERHLKHEKYFTGVGKSGHLPDGVLIFKDDKGKEKKVAIEVELRTKSKVRIQSILKWYSAQFEFAEVWYFCPDDVAKALRAGMSEAMKFVKIFSLRDIKK